jgi:single-strand selective monofunctional uracil DNA glycosylase
MRSRPAAPPADRRLICVRLAVYGRAMASRRAVGEGVADPVQETRSSRRVSAQVGEGPNARKSGTNSAHEALIAISQRLSDRVSRLKFDEPVTHTYNPLTYARAAHEAYLTRYGAGPKEVVLVGMNPGPFGMVQTGVPFGDVTMVRDWLAIETDVAPPRRVHDKRPVLGFACARREVSGTRLWSWAKERFGTPERFFARFFVVNYCPLAFVEASGKNRTPDRLPAAEREPLFAACDAALAEVIDVLAPRHVVGIGAFAEARARQALADRQLDITTILHPSPQSPLANSGWAARIEAQLELAGIQL